jgi:hypothetical protein
MSQSQDRKLVSSEPWEVETIHRHFPAKSHAEVERALQEVKKELSGSESREKIMERLREKLR